MKKKTTSFRVEKFGKYLLVDQIASGGMAVIYKAMAKMADGSIQSFAIKRILPQYAKDQEFISLLHDEAKLMVQLNHPNIVTMVEFGKHSEQFYIAMEYVEGITLKDLIHRIHDQEAVFTLDMATHIIREIAIGLSYAHRKKGKDGNQLKLVHRDISPANILLSFQGDIKVADFGISKAQSQSHKTQVGIIRGKIGYMSPEQTRSNIEIDHRSDLFSLGIIFYEMVTGIRLFSAKTIPEAIKLVREGEVPAPSEVREDIPKALENIMMKILAFDRVERYQHAQDIVDELNEFLVQHAPLGRPIRISHVDLMGFVKRFFKKEISNASTEVLKKQDFEKIVEEESKPQPVYHEPSQTFAANPMFEISIPETTVKDRKQFAKAQKELMREHGYVPISDKTNPSLSLPQVDEEDSPTHTEHTILTNQKKMILALPFVILLIGFGYFLFRSPPTSPVTPNEPMVIKKNPLRTIRIESIPEGATVYVNNVENTQPTPVSLRIDLNNPVELRLEAKGYVPITKVITKETYKDQMRIALDPNPDATRLARVSLSSEPEGAKIMINGVEIDQTTPATLELEMGQVYEASFVKEGYESKKTSIDVKNLTVVQKSVFLNKAKSTPKVTRKPKQKVQTPALGQNQKAIKAGELNIITVPWSYVYINGKRIQETPLTNFQIPAGTHTVRLTNKAQKVEDHTMKIQVEANKKTICSYTFVSKKEKCRIE